MTGPPPVRLLSADVEHRSYDAVVHVAEKAARRCPGVELRRIVREAAAAAIAAQTGADLAEVVRLVREGVIRVEPGSATGLSWLARGMVSVRLDT